MTQRTKSGLATQVSTLFADNTEGDISAADIRSVQTDYADSLVGGPTSATDNAIVRYDLTSGQLVQDSSVLIDDTNNITGVVNLTTTGYTRQSVGNALTAVGTTRADALALTAQVNNVTTAAASTGVILPAGVTGDIIILENAGANLIQVYADGSDTIDGVAGATGVPLTNALRCMYICVATNTFISAQLGVISA